MNGLASRVFVLILITAWTGCASASDQTEKSASNDHSPSTVAESSPYEPGTKFPTEAFTELSEDTIPEETASEFQAAIEEMAGKAGMSATVMSPEGTWNGTTGKADGVRDVQVNDQFAIGSVTKSIIAAQLMQLVEDGELALDDKATDHLPKNLDFDSNDATIRHLLSHRSGIPDYWTKVRPTLSIDRKEVWTTKEMLDLVSADRTPAGESFVYSNTNYLLLELVIEEVTGREVVDVLRDGVLQVEGTDRLIYQPDERPTEPMAMPNGESTDALKKGGGFLSSIASATAGPTTGAMATDALSLARWWRAFCAGEIVSQSSLDEMTEFRDDYGLGLYSPWAWTVGHTGEDFGYVAWAGCLPDYSSVIVVLRNRVSQDLGGMTVPLVTAVTSD